MSTKTSAASIVVGVVALGVTLGVLAGLAMTAAERFPREEAVAGHRAVIGRRQADQRRWTYAAQPGAPPATIEPGPMHLQLFCEQCPPPTPTDL